MTAIVSQITGDPIVWSTVCSGADLRKHQSSVSLAFVRRIHPWSVYCPHKGPVTRKLFPFDDVVIFGGDTRVFYLFHRSKLTKWAIKWMPEGYVAYMAFGRTLPRYCHHLIVDLAWHGYICYYHNIWIIWYKLIYCIKYTHCPGKMLPKILGAKMAWFRSPRTYLNLAHMQSYFLETLVSVATFSFVPLRCNATAM